MARFDVYSHPDASERKNLPFLLDVHNDYIYGLDSRIVIPLRPATLYQNQLQDLNLVFGNRCKKVVLDSASLAAFPARELNKSVASLHDQREEIVAGLQCIFGTY